MKEKLYLIFICFLSISPIRSQKEISKKDSIKIIQLNDLAYDFLFTNIDSSLFYAKKQLAQSKKVKSNYLLASSYSIMSSAYMYQNELDSSLFFIKKSLAISYLINNEKSIGKNYMNLALIYDKLNKNDSALLTYKKCLNIFTKIKDSNEIAITYLNLGSLLLTKFQEIDSAILLFKKAEKHSDNSSRIRNAIYQNLGIIYKNKGQTSRALNYYLKSLTLLKDKKNELFRLSLFINISSVYIKDGNFSKAREYIDKCEELSFKMNFQEGVCRSQLQKGLLFLALKKMDSAIICFNSAINLAKTENVSDVKKDAFHHLAYIKFLAYKNALNSQYKNDYYSNKNLFKYEDSIHYYISLSKSHDLAPNTSKTNLNNLFIEGQILELQKHNIEALYLYKKAFKKAKANKWVNLQIQIAKSTSILLEKTNLYKEALLWEKISNNLNDSLFNLRKQNQIEDIKIELEKNIEINKIREASNQNKIKHQKEITKNISIGFILAIVILLLFIYIIMNNIKKRNHVLKNIKTQKKIIEMELLILRSQMNPHFLFNTIQSIQSYILQNDAKNSYEYLTKFSSLLRSMIGNSKLSYISVSEEISIITNYLELEQMRLDHQFSFQIKCDPNILKQNIKIQPMLIQPLIENSIIHGFEQLRHKGILKINLKKVGGFIIIEVDDNGIGRTRSNLTPSKHKSVAINNIKERLSSFNGCYLTYIDKHENKNPMGTLAIIKAKAF